MNTFTTRLFKSLLWTYLWSILALLGFVTATAFGDSLWLALILYGLVGSIIIILVLLFYTIPLHLILRRFGCQSLGWYLLIAIMTVPIFIFVSQLKTFEHIMGMTIWSTGVALVGACSFWWYQIGRYRRHQ